MMSKQLAVSAALSIFLMSGFVVLGSDLGASDASASGLQLLAPSAETQDREGAFLPSLDDLLP